MPGHSALAASSPGSSAKGSIVVERPIKGLIMKPVSYQSYCPFCWASQNQREWLRPSFPKFNSEDFRINSAVATTSISGGSGQSHSYNIERPIGGSCSVALFNLICQETLEFPAS